MLSQEEKMISSAKMVTLISNDVKEFEVPMKVVEASKFIMSLIGDGDALFVSSKKVRLSNVNAVTLAKVIEYCKKHVDHESTLEDGGSNNTHSSNNTREVSSSSNTREDGSSSNVSAQNKDEELKKWVNEFFEGEKFESIFEIILAANYLEIKKLLDDGCQVVADRIKDKSYKEVGEIFNIENDNDPKEIEEIRKQNSWAFQI